LVYTLLHSAFMFFKIKSTFCIDVLINDIKHSEVCHFSWCEKQEVAYFLFFCTLYLPYIFKCMKYCTVELSILEQTLIKYVKPIMYFLKYTIVWEIYGITRNKNQK
jgi:hypothetical protein